MLKLQTDETRLVLTNRQKVFWPDVGFTKGDLLDYYREIAPVIMPHLVDRPIQVSQSRLFTSSISSSR